MLWNIEFFWGVLAFGTVTGIAYMMCLMMESTIGREGYGPMGNAFLIVAGFFGAILVANYNGINLKQLDEAITYGLGGAFVTFLVMLLARAVILRLWPS